MPGAHKIGAAISGPGIAGGNFMDTALFLNLSIAMDFGGYYRTFQNHYTHEIIAFDSFRGLQLQLSGVFTIN